ncbi:MAG: hypothetical protein QG580_237 [Patescibacteria group bacterium]|jgi:hypothetical protein|nr:hypothetical protein [Patescibacteria group bacterium]
MKKFLSIFTITFGLVAGVNAQSETRPPDGFGLPVPGSSAEVSAWEEACKFNTDGETCTVTIRYTSDTYPLEFIQGDKVLDVVYDKDAEIGFQVVEGVVYEKLPGGGYSYVLEIKNPRGRTYIMKRVGA